MNRTLQTGFRLSLLLLLPMAMTATLNAASVSYNTPFGPSAIPFPSTGYALPKFDPALGTLTQVTLTLTADTSAGSITFDNEAAVPTTLTLGIGATVTASAPSALTLVAVPLQNGGGSVAADDDGAPDYSGADSFSVSGGSGSDSDSQASTAPATLAAYTATFLGEDFLTNIDATLSTFLSTSGGFGPLDASEGVTEGLITVTYDFEVVPEPGTVVLGALGALGLVAAGWRRRRSS